MKKLALNTRFKMIYISIFIIYIITISALSWFVNRPKKLSDIYGGPSPLSMSIGEFIKEYKPNKNGIPPYMKNQIEMLENDDITGVVLKKNRKSVLSGVQYGKTQQQAEFVQQYLGNPFKANAYQSALSIPPEKRTPFEKWKASDPANTYTPWWLCERSMRNMPDVVEFEYSREQPKIQRKAFEGGRNSFTQEVKRLINLLDEVL
jgi:hypothetical protein